MQNVIHNNNDVAEKVTVLVDLSIVLPCVFFFTSLCPRINLRFTHFYFAHQHNSCNQHFIGYLRQNVGESGHAISSWSASTGYLAEMFSECAKLDLSSTCQLGAPMVNISAEYPALLDHDLMNNPSIYSLHYV